jgi:UDP-N-acetyl-D-glucosamine dehydrogenase
MEKTLLARIQDRSARIGIVGQGYVGLPLALLFHEAGSSARGSRSSSTSGPKGSPRR